MKSLASGLKNLSSRRTKKPRKRISTATREDGAKTLATSTRPQVSDNNLTGKKLAARAFVDATLRKGVSGLITEFKNMKRANDFGQMTAFVDANTRKLNRYKDVGCLDNNRIVLTMGAEPYIHANYVSTPTNKKKFICTQAPLPNTMAEFWYMMVQENCKVILMLCNFVEKGAKKCAEYYPVTPGEVLSVANCDISISCTSRTQHKFSVETKQIVQITYLEVRVAARPAHVVVHYQWLDWPDRGVPEADVTPVALLGTFRDLNSPVVVHCSAGIGRTGSIVLLQVIIDMFQNGTMFTDLDGHLDSLRKQRNNSIQTEHQYLYVHQVLLLYFRRTNVLDTSIYSQLDKFTEAYNKATK